MNKFDAFGEDRELLGRDEDYPPAPAVAGETHEWEPDFSDGEPALDDPTCGLCGKTHTPSVAAPVEGNAGLPTVGELMGTLARLGYDENGVCLHCGHDACDCAASTPPPAATVSRDLEGKLRELAKQIATLQHMGIERGLEYRINRIEEHVREAAALGRAEGLSDAIKVGEREWSDPPVIDEVETWMNGAYAVVEALRALREKV